jgi:hypothetical protein
MSETTRMGLSCGWQGQPHRAGLCSPMRNKKGVRLLLPGTHTRGFRETERWDRCEEPGRRTSTPRSRNCSPWPDCSQTQGHRRMRMNESLVLTFLLARDSFRARVVRGSSGTQNAAGGSLSFASRAAACAQTAARHPPTPALPRAHPRIPRTRTPHLQHQYALITPHIPHCPQSPRAPRRFFVAMVGRTYLRYRAAGLHGLIASSANIASDATGKLVFTGQLENVGVWNVRRGVQVSLRENRALRVFVSDSVDCPASITSPPLPNSPHSHLPLPPSFPHHADPDARAPRQ